MPISLETLKELQKGAVKRHKFNARYCVLDGIKFSSKLEGCYYTRLKLREKTGEVLFFFRQTPIHLPGNVKYVVDFTVFLSDGTVEFIDTKGRDTPLSITKRKQVEALYPIKIQIVRS